MKKIATALTALLVISLGVQVADASSKPVGSAKSLMSGSKFFFPKTSRPLLKPMALDVAPLTSPALPALPTLSSVSVESETVEIESETVEIESETVSLETHGIELSGGSHSDHANSSPSSHQPHEMTSGITEEEGRRD